MELNQSKVFLLPKMHKLVENDCLTQQKNKFNNTKEVF